MLLSARAESNQRRAKGAPSTNTWLTPVFIGVAPLDPHYGGTPSCQIVESSRRPEHKILHPPCPSPQGPIWSEISKCLRCADTAYSGKTVAAGPSTTAAPQGGTPEAKRSFAESSFAYFSYKKSRRSRPRIGTRAPKKTLRGATQFQTQNASLWPFLCGRENRTCLQVRCWRCLGRLLPLRPSQPRGRSLSGGVSLTHAPSLRWMVVSYLEIRKKSRESRQKVTLIQ